MEFYWNIILCGHGKRVQQRWSCISPWSYISLCPSISPPFGVVGLYQPRARLQDKPDHLLIACVAIKAHKLTVKPYNMLVFVTCSTFLKGKFGLKSNWDMLYAMSWFKWHMSCLCTTFRSWDTASQSFDYIIDYIISVTSLVQTVCTSIQSLNQWCHRNDVIKTLRGCISRTKCRTQARHTSFESARCVQQHISVWF